MTSPSYNYLPGSTIFKWINVIAVLVLAGTMTACAQVSEDETELDIALKAEDWERVFALGTNVNAETSEPVENLLMAHAALALNRSNESVCLFHSVMSSDSTALAKDLSAWDHWTEHFARRHKEEPIAHYFRGDALARLEQWDAAIESFDRALISKPDHALVLNARGVVHAIRGDWEEAVVDLQNASSSELVDAYTNRGTLNIHRMLAAEGAVRWFNRALATDSTNVLARQGRGAALFALGKEETSKRDFLVATEATPCADWLVAQNLVAITDYMLGLDSYSLAIADDAGTTLERRYDTFKQNPSQWNTNRLISNLRTQPPEVQQMYTDRFQNDVRQDPNWGRNAVNSVSTVERYNAPTGTGETWARLSDINIMGTSLGTGTREGRVAVTRENYDTARRLNNGLSYDSNQGGVSMNLTTAHLDDGNWPIRPVYGLLYAIER